MSFSNSSCFVKHVTRRVWWPRQQLRVVFLQKGCFGCSPVSLNVILLQDENAALPFCSRKQIFVQHVLVSLGVDVCLLSKKNRIVEVFTDATPQMDAGHLAVRTGSGASPEYASQPCLCLDFRRMAVRLTGGE